MKMKTTIQSHVAKPHPALAYVGMLLTLLAAAVLHSGSAAAASVGRVVNLSDPSQLLARKADGTTKVLIHNSTVDNGDVLESQTNTYARIKFIDNSEITLAPNTQLKIENYSFDENKPQEDRSVFSLIKGTLRSITGSLGKRSIDRYELKTPAATIGIRGTNYIAKYVPMEEATEPEAKDTIVKEDKCDPRRSGLTVEVTGGIIYLTNDGGAQKYSAGEFGCVASFKQAPVTITNPGIQFTPSFTKSIQCKV